MAKFIREYVDKVLTVTYEDLLAFEFSGNDQEVFDVKIKPLSFIMVLENLIGNSIKANASKIAIKMQSDEKFFTLEIKDNGDGLNKTVKNKQDLFEFGVTTTQGSGLGLYYAQKYMRELHGAIDIVDNSDKGVSIILRWEKK